MTRSTASAVSFVFAALLLGASSGCGAGGPEGILRTQAYDLFDCAHVSVRREGPSRSGPGVYVVEGCDGAARVACTDSVKAMGWHCQEPGEATGAWAPTLAKRTRCRECRPTRTGCAREEDGAPGCGGVDCPQGYVSMFEPCPPECCE